MIRTRKWLLVVMVTGLFMAPAGGNANVGPLEEFKGSGAVTPKSPHETIRLDSEEVVIRLTHRTYVVDVVFHLFNTGETSTEWIGFPKWVASRRAPVYPTFMRFEGWVNDRKVQFDDQGAPGGGGRPASGVPLRQESRDLPSGPMEEARQWLVSRATFPGHAGTTIRIRYEAAYGYDGQGRHEASYIYGTGSLWKGNIDKAVFIVDSTEVGGTAKISTYFEKGFGPAPNNQYVKSDEHVEASPRPLLNNTMRYEIRDFKPHPEAYLRVSLNESSYFRVWGDYVRTKNRVPLAIAPPAAPHYPPLLPPRKFSVTE